jgi:protein-tyrosine phosphatase
MTSIVTTSFYFYIQFHTYMKKVLFVCLGNICRSPLAEGIFQHKVQQRNLSENFLAESCGTANYHVGHTPDPRTLKNAQKNGVTLDHFGRQLQETDLQNFDLIFAMDENNLDNIYKLKNAKDHTGKISLMRSFDPEKTGLNVPDPYYGTEVDFQEVFNILDRCIDNLLNALIQEKN